MKRLLEPIARYTLRQNSRFLLNRVNSMVHRITLKAVYGLKLKKAPEKLNVIIKYPSRSRPELFKHCLDRWINMLSFKHHVKFVCSFDEDDEAMKTDAVRSFINEKRKRVKIDVYYNPQPQTKVSAINANLESHQADMLILCQDDMEPLVQGYDDLMAKYLFRYFPDGDGVINIRLSFNHNWWKTGVQIPVMGWKYYQRFNYIFYPEYISVCGDIELRSVAEKLGKLAHINDTRIVIHDWQYVNDDLRQHTESDSIKSADNALFRRRKAGGFDL